MAYNYTLNYRTFDDLLADCKSDFKKYAMEDLISPEDLIKVAKRVNYDLGLRINTTKERILEVENGRVRLPNDLYILDMALFVGKYSVKQYLPQGTHVEEKIIGQVAPEYQTAPPETIDLCEDVVVTPDPCDPCDPCAQCGAETNCEPCNACCTNPESCSLNCNGDVIQLVQKVHSETREYTEIYPLSITQNTEILSNFCPNTYWQSGMNAVIEGTGSQDKWLKTSFQTGKIYISYQGHLEDDEGNLLVPNHDLLNEYYEYAVKQRIIENLIMNDQEVSQTKLQLIETRFRTSRNAAQSLVKTPNFGELKELHKANRRAQHKKYYAMFSSHGNLRMR